MATKTKNSDGSFRVRFTNHNNRRLELRFKKGQSDLAETARQNIEQLIQHRLSKSALPNPLAAWLAEIPESLHDKLRRYDLVDKRAAVKNADITYVDYIQQYIDERQDTASANTLRNHRQSMNKVRKHFGDTILAAITVTATKRFRDKLLTTLAPATVSREIRRNKQFMDQAIDEGIITTNPFDGIYGRNEDNDQRMYYIDVDTILRVIDSCPNADWRLIVAFARFGGLRIPSEINNLKWSDIDWQENRMTVDSPKNAKKRGSPYRIVPLFKELRPYLEQAFEAAPEGAEYCIGRYREPDQNLRTQLCRILRRAGVQQWPKLFVNLRSSRETDLNNQFPQHVVCKWMDNSPTVAMKHYLQITDAHFGAAVGHEDDQAVSRPGEKFPQKFTQQTEDSGCQQVPPQYGDTEKQGIDESCVQYQYPQGDVNTCSVSGATATFRKTSPNNSPTAQICRVNIQPKKQKASEPVDKSERLTRALLMLAGIPMADSAREELARTIAARIADEQ